MTVIDLIKKLDDANIPDNAQVFIEADHGQYKENANSIVVSRTVCDDYMDPESMIWEFKNYDLIYDEDDIAAYDTAAPITAVLISG